MGPELKDPLHELLELTADRDEPEKTSNVLPFRGWHGDDDDPRFSHLATLSSTVRLRGQNIFARARSRRRRTGRGSRRRSRDGPSILTHQAHPLRNPLRPMSFRSVDVANRLQAMACRSKITAETLSQPAERAVA